MLAAHSYRWPCAAGDLLKYLNKAGMLQAARPARNRSRVASPSSRPTALSLSARSAAQDDAGSSSPRGFFVGMMEGISFCHGLGVHHRDIKLENLMLAKARQHPCATGPRPRS